LRFVGSPYTRERPEDCGYKAVHGYIPFFLLLRRAGKDELIDGYLRFFYEWGAPLQIMDDIVDLEDDIRNGHYSYPTLGFEDTLKKASPMEAAAIITSDKEHMKRMREVCRGLIESSKRRSVEINADLFGYFVSLLEMRLDAFFSEKLKDSA
jgi:hypothetical protein